MLCKQVLSRISSYKNFDYCKSLYEQSELKEQDAMSKTARLGEVYQTM
jgi:hypothetical protein